MTQFLFYGGVIFLAIAGSIYAGGIGFLSMFYPSRSSANDAPADITPEDEDKGFRMLKITLVYLGFSLGISVVMFVGSIASKILETAPQ